ncbi:hypothetical protein WI61_05105 [Burkholderia cepacia]|nr:hypothetical protein WI48_26535 [Burkholderia cepacia]KVA70681.1 hypothetical protein WI49_35875 [Burkholderia cepacia]KVA79575.1 hypothetical protein WI51_27160 [Burkholderia cepacia]KVA80717.1 hypothetical protein WI50_26260 [Burkholderia cepacia]KVA87918.1 hypothetical protein WI52_01215 [Burkholderia cepacia]
MFFLLAPYSAPTATGFFFLLVCFLCFRPFWVDIQLDQCADDSGNRNASGLGVCLKVRFHLRRQVDIKSLNVGGILFQSFV